MIINANELKGYAEITFMYSFEVIIQMYGCNYAKMKEPVLSLSALLICYNHLQIKSVADSELTYFHHCFYFFWARPLLVQFNSFSQFIVVCLVSFQLHA